MKHFKPKNVQFYLSIIISNNFPNTCPIHSKSSNLLVDDAFNFRIQKVCYFKQINIGFKLISCLTPNAQTQCKWQRPRALDGKSIDLCD
jgi:hypothetical protein